MAKFVRNHFLPPAIWALLILTVSSIPRLSPPPIGLTFTDKLAHFSEYLILGFFSLTAFLKSGNSGRKSFTATFLICAAMGVLDELHQFLIPGRSVELLDAAANVSGSLAGAVLALIFKNRFSRRSAGPDRPSGAK